MNKAKIISAARKQAQLDWHDELTTQVFLATGRLLPRLPQPLLQTSTRTMTRKTIFISHQTRR